MSADPVLALAEAMHNEDDTCNASQYVPFSECATRQWDIEHAADVLAELRKAGWRLAPDPAGTVELGLVS